MFRVIFLSLLWCLSNSPSWAVELNAESLGVQMKQIEQDTSLADTQKKQLLTLYEQARTYLSQQTEYLAQADKYQQAIKSAPVETRQLQQTLDSLNVKTLPTEADLLKLTQEELNQELVSNKSRLLNFQTEYDDSVQQLNQTQNDLPSTTALLHTQKTQFAQLTEMMNQSPNVPAVKTVPNVEANSSAVFDAAVKVAQQLRLNAEYQSVGAKIKQLQQSSLSHEYRLTLLQAKTELLKQQIYLTETELSLQQKVINLKQEQNALQLATKIKQEQQTSQDKTQVEQTAIARNHALSGELSQLSQKIIQVTQDKIRQQRYFEQLQYDFDSLQQQFEIAGLNKNLADVLYQQKKKLPQISAYQKNDVKTWQQQLVDSRLAQFQLNREQQTLVHVNQVVQDLLQTAKLAQPSLDSARVEANLLKILQERQTLLNQLNDVYSQYIKLLYGLENERKQLWQQAERYIDLLDEKLFWIPNLKPINWLWLEAFYQAPLPFGSYQQWQQTEKNLLPQMVEHPVVLWLWFVLFSSSLIFRRYIHRGLVAQNKYVHNVLKDNFFYTIKAIFFSLLLALPWVLLLNGLAWVLLQTNDQQFSHVLGNALFYAGIVFFLVEFLRYLCIDDGVFHNHFFWSKPYCDTLYFNLTWFQFLIFPLLFIITLTQSQSYIVDNVLVQETWGRLALIGSCFAIFFLLIAIFKRHLVQRFWLWTLIIGATALPVVLAFNGYYYTSLSMGIRLFHSTGFIAASLLLYYLVARWIMIVERQLAFQQAMAHQRELYANSQKSEAQYSFKLDQNAIQLPDINLDGISEQTRALLRLIVFSFLISGLWFTWVDITPVLTLLDDVVLWQTSSEVDGVMQIMPVTFYDVSFTLLALLVTVTAAQNLPGMLELVLLQRLALRADKRYTIVTLIKYIIMVTGVLIAAHSLGLRWNQVQWLAAALSVGLGFGLQEIFANFVSGLIILFERPIRIGDMVTVGDINGEVTRIHMRTTIITDRNNKELIVPNKSFITNELINWSLTDTNVRVIIPIGVAYGSDIELVEKLLFDIIKAEPLVLPQYTSRVFLLNFGESSLNFEVRVYVSEYANQNLARHKINKEIERLFRLNHIAIPFPQRDVHVFNHHINDGVIAD